ncbi:MAG: hypothetical protein U0L72_05745 [Acutalibacteraceae bacterium]|nr:hypothetical protein [Acutalibacteraceae bacterium]
MNKMNKLTDNEIIKAFEVCYIERYGDCSDCPFCNEDMECTAVADNNLLNEVLDQINRQKAEIERYKGVIKILEKDVKDAEGRAVKEFAHYLIDNGEEGKINTFDLPDYVCEFLSKPEKVEHDSLCETETYKTLKERF